MKPSALGNRAVAQTSITIATPNSRNAPNMSVISIKDRWAAAMKDWFMCCGAPRHRVARITRLVESALLGFHVDLATDTPEELSRGVRDLADAAQALAG